MLIGTAMSAHQSEGNNINSDWWYFEKNGKLPYKSGMACDSYRHYKDDIKLMKRLRLNSYKFSIEFARVMPEKDVVDYDAIDHYRDIIAELKKNGIEPIPTLWHYTFPLWFYKMGGFENRKNLVYIINYVKLLLSRGLDARYVLTLNEPMVYAVKAYLTGRYPPFRRSFRSMLKVSNNLIHLHNELYDILSREGYKVSIAKNMIYFGKLRRVYLPFGLSEYIYNWRFIKYAKMDFLGLNYYRNVDPFRLVRRRSNKTDMGWTIYPYGLHSIAERYYNAYKKPIMITENGIATNNEDLRKKFITEHLNTIITLRKEGVPVIGYHYWSLLDNFEWDYGYMKKFGIGHVDKKTGKRILKSSAETLKRLALKYE